MSKTKTFQILDSPGPVAAALGRAKCGRLGVVLTAAVAAPSCERACRHDDPQASRRKCAFGTKAVFNQDRVQTHRSDVVRLAWRRASRPQRMQGRGESGGEEASGRALRGGCWIFFPITTDKEVYHRTSATQRERPCYRTSVLQHDDCW